VIARFHVEYCLYQGPSKDEGQGARGTTGASKELRADMREGFVELSGQDVVSWYTPWQNLYLVVAQVQQPYAWHSSI